MKSKIVKRFKGEAAKAFLRSLKKGDANGALLLTQVIFNIRQIKHKEGR